MNTLRLDFNGHVLRADPDAGVDISIPLDFHGEQPNHFGAGAATAEPMTHGAFIGDTRAGGSCNAEVLTLNPHCNGTHTECVGHVTKERIAVRDVLSRTLMPAALITVEPATPDATDERCDPAPQPTDRLLTGERIAAAWSRLHDHDYPALVIRTLPNGPDKRSRRYTADAPHPYLTLDAVELIVRAGVSHLLLDTPSLDRYDDGGRLAGHRLFWGLLPAARSADGSPRSAATITEMVFVPDDIEDGIFLLDLQIAPFVSDAAPSRPMLFSASPASA